MSKKDETILNQIKDNKNSQIMVVNNFGNTDSLSLNEIYNKRKDLKQIENSFSERIDCSCNILSSSALPRELQNDFEIKSKIENGKFEYYTEAKTEDAYKKFPRKVNIKMKFDTPKEKREFASDGGFFKLIEQANLSRQPVRIPNVSEMKEFLGEFENPTSDINNSSIENVALYILPKPFPEALEYSIEVLDNDISFKIEKTKLRLSELKQDYYIINNFESVDEPFDISLRIDRLEDVNRESNKKEIRTKINLTIALRNKVQNDCYYNLELQKFIFTINSSNNIFIIRNNSNNTETIRSECCGKDKYTKKNYKDFKRIIDLISNVIFLEKKFNIKVDYNLKYFFDNEDIINLIVSDLKERRYKLKKEVTMGFYINDYDEDTYKNIETEISIPITIFNRPFYLRNSKLLLRNCKFVDRIEKEGESIIAISSKNVQCIPNKK